MERSITKKLAAWKERPNRKPLILQGARQVGKTWIMKEFGRQYFEFTAYVNLDNNPAMKLSFEKDYNVRRLIEDIEIETKQKITAENTLIIIDEIQEVPAALGSLKYFYEETPEYHIIVAGSLLGVAIHSGASFPVGKVNLLTMYPLSFAEFMSAMGEDALTGCIDDVYNDKNTTFRDRFAELLRKYYYTGGMPEAVQTYIDSGDTDEVRSVQKEIIKLYESDFSKHIENRTELERTRLVWNSVPMQLAKENKKFFFGKIKKGARSADFEISIQWLCDCGLLYKIYSVSKPGMPLSAYVQFSSFKLFAVDVGLLGAMAQLDARTILEGNRIFTEFKGALTEQYVLQELISSGDYTPYYYSNDNSTNEIDFLIQDLDRVVPLEVKAEENLRSKSLKAFTDKFEIERAVRFSMCPFREQSGLTNLPLWNVRGLKRYLEGERL